MDYEYDIFLSYSHGDLWTPWVKDMFLPRLHAYLETEVGRKEISVDHQIQPGTLWDPNLRRRVHRSAIMLSLISANYFQREWCRLEMALMFERERHLGLEGRDDNYGLVIPIRLGDGNTFPDLIKSVQYLDFERFADPDLPKGTQRASEFNDKVKELAQVIARTLPLAPPKCSSEWGGFTGNDFLPRLNPKVVGTLTPSRLKV